MFLKHGSKNANDINLVAPTGFEPVYQDRRTLLPGISDLRRDTARGCDGDGNPGLDCLACAV